MRGGLGKEESDRGGIGGSQGPGNLEENDPQHYFLVS